MQVTRHCLAAGIGLFEKSHRRCLWPLFSAGEIPHCNCQSGSWLTIYSDFL